MRGWLCGCAVWVLISGLGFEGAAQQGRPHDVQAYVDPLAKPEDAASFRYATIQTALDHAPQVGPDGHLVLHIAPGVYKERVSVSKLRPRTTFLGVSSDPSQVVITAAMYAKIAGGTFFTETVDVEAEGFEADGVTFENAAGNVGQAVAVRVEGDKAIFKHCRFLGDQDTLLANSGRQLYADSYIRGGVDFIFGNATAVFERDEIHIIRPGYLTAQSRTAPTQATGYVFNHSRVTAEDWGEKPFYLGRPWRMYSRVVFLHTEMPAGLSPQGWMEWPANTPDPKTTFYAEFESSGPGAQPGERVPWSHQLNEREAAAFAPERFLAGPDHWDAMGEAAKLP